MAQPDAATVRKEVVVDAPIERAFSVFTARFGDFKPPEHNMLGAPIAETVFEPRVGGGIIDRATDGSECRWARILAFEPPDRVVFSWDISPQWTIETDPAQSSEVEVRFYAESPTRTRVELEHRHIDRHGPGWPRSPPGWTARKAGRCTWTATPRSLRTADMPPIVATAEIGRPAAEVFAYATDPARFSEWQQGVVAGHMDSSGRRQRNTGGGRDVRDHAAHRRG